jgi:D-alanyl-D-alanine carboxypeptidase
MNERRFDLTAADFEAEFTFETGPPRGREAGPGAPGSFQPVPVESPGGGRIRNKRDPNPADLVAVPRVFGGSVPLHRLAAQALDAMQRAARAEGIAAPILLPTSGYRSAVRQAELWKGALARSGGDVEKARLWVAPPGGSAHQSGRAVDLYLGSKNARENVAAQRKTAAWQWLKRNAVRFGFYPYGSEPWHWEYNPLLRSTPVQNETSLIKGATSPVVGEERTPPALTQIVEIPLRAGSTPEWRPWSAVYFPPAVDRNSRTIDVILYLHGFRTGHPGSRKSIWDYLKHKYWPLREHLAASGKAAVLIAPTLGPKGEPAGLLKPGGLDRYLDAALAATGSYWSSGVAPAIRNIVLAGHSAAGRPMLSLARSENRYAALIKEVWGFDCTYSAAQNVDSTGWAAWARAHPQSRLFIYYLRGGPTQAQADKLRKRALPNVSVTESNAQNHYWVPIQHWGKRLAESPYLRG